MTENPPLSWHALPNAPAIGTVLGHSAEIADGQVIIKMIPDDNKPFSVLLLKSGSEVKAFANRCAHFGVPLASRQEHLQFQPHISITCNVHYARYRWSDGVCDRGDCEGEALIAIPVECDTDGCIRIAEVPPCR